MNLSVAMNVHRVMIKNSRFYLLCQSPTQTVLMLVVFIILGAQLVYVVTRGKHKLKKNIQLMMYKTMK
jgi:prolipoprotein diacylglyceryltransferase